MNAANLCYVHGEANLFVKINEGEIWRNILNTQHQPGLILIFQITSYIRSYDVLSDMIYSLVVLIGMSNKATAWISLLYGY